MLDDIAYEPPELKGMEEDWYATHPVEFKPQTWHVEIGDPGILTHEVEGAFVSRKVAEEVRDEYNADTNKLGFPGNAYICLCDCPNRECKYL